MIGLIALAAVALYVGAWWFVVRTLHAKWAKAAAITVALAIPFWDLPIGYFYFQKHCSTDGGLRLHAKFPALNVVMFDANTGYTPEYAAKFGFKVMEYKEGTTIHRYYFDANKVRESNHSDPVSDVKVTILRNRVLPWNLSRGDALATKVSDGQLLASTTEFRWFGTWWQALAAPLLGYGAYCFAGTDQILVALNRGNR